MAIIKIKAPSAWDTIPAGLAASGDVMALDRIQDSFNDGALNAVNFQALESGTGTVKENEALELYSPAVIDIAGLLLKTAISKVITDTYSIRWRPESSGMYPIMTQQAVGLPVVVPPATIDATRVINVYLTAINGVGIFYIDNVGAAKGWNGVAWVAGAPVLTTLNFTSLYEAQIEVDSANARWRVILKNIADNVVIATTDWVLWAATRDTGAGDLWFTSGDFYSNVISGAMIISSFRNLFKTGPLVSTMGEIAGDGSAIEQIPITENVEAGAAISYKYNLNRAGLSAAKTLAEFTAELVGQSMSFFDMETTYTSDGEADASFDINGGAIACPSATCDFPGIGEVTLGTVFDNGNLTGTYKEVPEPKAEFGFDYGAGGVEFTGELSPFQASYELPQEVIIEDDEIVIIEECV